MRKVYFFMQWTRFILMNCWIPHPHYNEIISIVLVTWKCLTVIPFPSSLELAQDRISVSTMGVPSGLNLDNSDKVYFLISCHTKKLAPKLKKQILKNYIISYSPNPSVKVLFPVIMSLPSIPTSTKLNFLPNSTA